MPCIEGPHQPRLWRACGAELRGAQRRGAANEDVPEGPGAGHPGPREAEVFGALPPRPSAAQAQLNSCMKWLSALLEGRE
eukprot:2095201-Lingulodinium_polyedra.AAC.1